MLTSRSHRPPAGALPTPVRPESWDSRRGFCTQKLTPTDRLALCAVSLPGPVPWAVPSLASRCFGLRSPLHVAPGAISRGKVGAGAECEVQRLMGPRSPPLPPLPPRERPTLCRHHHPGQGPAEDTLSRRVAAGGSWSVIQSPKWEDTALPRKGLPVMTKASSQSNGSRPQVEMASPRPTGHPAGLSHGWGAADSPYGSPQELLGEQG